MKTNGIDINKDDQSALKMLNESAHGTMKMIRQPKVASNKILHISQIDNNRIRLSLFFLFLLPCILSQIRNHKPYRGHYMDRPPF